MSKQYTIIVHDVAEDGLPPEDTEKAGIVGRVAFIFDGVLYSGWPLDRDNAEDYDDIVWEENEHALHFKGVKKWIELPVAGWEL